MATTTAWTRPTRFSPSSGAISTRDAAGTGEAAEEVAGKADQRAEIVATADLLAAGGNAGHRADGDVVEKDAAVDLADIDPGLDHRRHGGDRLGEVERHAEIAGEEIGGTERQHGERLSGSTIASASAVTVPSPPAATMTSASPASAAAMRSANCDFAVGVDGGIEARCDELFVQRFCREAQCQRGAGVGIEDDVEPGGGHGLTMFCDAGR